MRIIGGLYKGRKLEMVKSKVLRPTMGRMRELLFNVCQQEIEGAFFLDLFAGVGAMGLEALSRGASEVVFVERDRRHVAAIEASVAGLGVGKECQVLQQDVFTACRDLEKRGAQFDIIFADPPYGDKEHSLTNQLLTQLDQSNLLKRGGHLFLEDHKHASDYHEPLTHLQEQKRRQAGKTTLRQFIY